MFAKEPVQKEFIYIEPMTNNCCSHSVQPKSTTKQCGFTIEEFEPKNKKTNLKRQIE